MTKKEDLVRDSYIIDAKITALTGVLTETRAKLAKLEEERAEVARQLLDLGEDDG